MQSQDRGGPCSKATILQGKDPYAMRPKVEEKLDRLVAEGVIEPVAHAEWATPLAARLKSDKKTIRLCGDFRVTVNPVAKLDRCPVPKVEDLFATLKQGRLFMHWTSVMRTSNCPWMKRQRSSTLWSTQRGCSNILGSRSESHQPPLFSREKWNICSTGLQE